MGRRSLETKIKKVQKKVQKKGQIKIRQKGSNDSIAQYCIMAEVRKKFKTKVRNKSSKKSSKKSLKKSLLKKFENITNCWRGGWRIVIPMPEAAGKNRQKLDGSVWLVGRQLM
jgi:hypothetical protein